MYLSIFPHEKVDHLINQIGIILLFTLLPLWRHPHWFIRGIDFPCLQFMIFAAVLLTAHLFWLDGQMGMSQILIFATAVCFIWQLWWILWWILPFTLLWRKEVKTSNEYSADK
ncbi:hypothetical protein [Colwellia sp. C1TZA3]|uniref:hypothetical protein n=1 Tax=Colwellia sp. C1TZA3 TaxID=2508879 RepID=UPI001CB8968B|nr:hypothetical protein [Colwellia sp. C1TZA3]